VLEKIIAHKKALFSQKAKIDETGLSKSNKSLFRALTSGPTGFICEIKAASPSAGTIRKNVNPLEIAKIYDPFATAISVLTDAEFFGGSLENLKRVSEAVSCPVLAKDVVVSPAQIIEARRFGADAVLLMLSVLDDAIYRDCHKVADQWNLDVITEVHNEAELKRAIALKAKIIGINNRNLKNLEIDINNTERLLPLLPPGQCVIAESGFYAHSQIERLKHKVNAFLIGSSLMRAERIDLALRELVFGRVKICGLTNAEDAKNAYEAGAYYGGLNFAAHYPRRVNLAEAKSIIAGAPLVFGGVFVNQAVDDVLHLASELKLNFVQLHGEEGKDYLRQLRVDLPSQCEIWKAIRVKDSIDIPKHLGAEVIVLDNYAKGLHGGSGQSFDWQLIGNELFHLRFALAGGINPKNVEKAAGFGASILDIASGVEDDNPRKKSKNKIQELFSNLRGRKL
jgi:indole-3-glycerol phosphate synthase/phosphoribosylanthranilate isomerase